MNHSLKYSRQQRRSGENYFRPDQRRKMQHQDQGLLAKTRKTGGAKGAGVAMRRGQWKFFLSSSWLSSCHLRRSKCGSVWWRWHGKAKGKMRGKSKERRKWKWKWKLSELLIRHASFLCYEGKKMRGEPLKIWQLATFKNKSTTANGTYVHIYICIYIYVCIFTTKYMYMKMSS